MNTTIGNAALTTDWAAETRSLVVQWNSILTKRQAVSEAHNIHFFWTRNESLLNVRTHAHQKTLFYTIFFSPLLWLWFCRTEDLPSCSLALSIIQSYFSDFTMTWLLMLVPTRNTTESCFSAVWPSDRCQCLAQSSKQASFGDHKSYKGIDYAWQRASGLSRMFREGALIPTKWIQINTHFKEKPGSDYWNQLQCCLNEATEIKRGLQGFFAAMLWFIFHLVKLWPCLQCSEEQENSKSSSVSFDKSCEHNGPICSWR